MLPENKEDLNLDIMDIRRIMDNYIDIINNKLKRNRLLSLLLIFLALTVCSQVIYGLSP